MPEPSVTFIYCRPEVLATVLGTVEVDEALALLALELGLGNGPDLRRVGDVSATISGVSPQATWAAMDRAIPLYRQLLLFFRPDLDGAQA